MPASFLRNEKSALDFINTFDTFSVFSGLKNNAEKCEIAGVGVKVGVQVALCEMESIYLTVDTITILGIYFL